jgi:toxin FitB
VSYLVDTDVFSEPAKPKPNEAVVAWLRANERSLYLSVITIGELRRGIERLPRGKRRDALLLWLSKVGDVMKGRVLSFNVSVANVWGQLKAGWDARGIVVPSLDSQIAATAHRHGLALVTRNEKHFRATGVTIMNPFAEGS